MRIALLCNDRLGLPATQHLAQSGLLRAAGTSDRSPELVAVMQQLQQQGGVPTQVFSRNGFESDLMAWLEAHRPDVVLVKTFPFRIPAAALRVPKHGFINFHYAPLPAWRGPNPLFRMICRGERLGAVVAHRMDEGLDTGPILLQQPVPLPEGGTFGICATQLAFAGASLTATLLQGLATGTLRETRQDTATATWHPRPQAADLVINWQAMDHFSVINLIKACNPWNKGAATRFGSWTLGITDASRSTLPVPAGVPPGCIFRLSPMDGVHIACAGGGAIEAKVIYTEEGFFAAPDLAFFGLKAGDCFL